MSNARSTYGLMLSDLLGRLDARPRSNLDPLSRAYKAFAEIASTPQMWPLDDVLYEMLLEVAGFDLTDPEHLQAALWATSLLVAGDPSYDGLFCGHDGSPTLFCNFLDDSDPDSQYLAVMDLAQQGAFDTIYATRKHRCAAHGIDDTGDTGEAGQADVA